VTLYALAVFIPWACLSSPTYYVADTPIATRGDYIDVTISATTDVATSAYSISLRFDPIAMEIVGVDFGQTYGERSEYQPVYSWDNMTGVLKIGVIVTDDCSDEEHPGLEPGSGQLVHLRFHIKDDAPVGTTYLEFEDIDLAKNGIAMCGGGFARAKTMDGHIIVRRFKAKARKAPSP